MPHNGVIRTRGVRWNAQTRAFEMWCPACAAKGGVATFWPLDEVSWDIHRGLARCRACWAEKKRTDASKRRAAKRDEIVAANRAYYQENRELLRWKDNQRKQERRQHELLQRTGS